MLVPNCSQTHFVLNFFLNWVKGGGGDPWLPEVAHYTLAGPLGELKVMGYQLICLYVPSTNNPAMYCLVRIRNVSKTGLKDSLFNWPQIVKGILVSLLRVTATCKKSCMRVIESTFLSACYLLCASHKTRGSLIQTSICILRQINIFPRRRENRLRWGIGGGGVFQRLQSDNFFKNAAVSVAADVVSKNLKIQISPKLFYILQNERLYSLDVSYKISNTWAWYTIFQIRDESQDRIHQSPTKFHQSPTKFHQSPTKFHQSPTKFHQSPTNINHQPTSITNQHQSPTKFVIINHQPTSITNQVSSITNQVCNHQSPTNINHQPTSITNQVSSITNQVSSITNQHQSPTNINHQPSFINHQPSLHCCFHTLRICDVFFERRPPMEVQETVKHQGVENNDSALVVALIRDMMSADCLAPHTCNPEEECTLCVLMTTFYQLHMDILAYLCPRVAIQNNRVADIVPHDLESSQTKVSPEESTQEPASSSTSPKPPATSTTLNTEGLLSAVVNMPQIVTATVETVGELDMAANIPQEHVVSAVATAVTLTDEDCAHATVNVVKASVVGEDDKPIDLTKEEEEEVGSYWVTSQGKFKYRIEELPPHLQVIFTMFNHLENTEDGDVIYHMCQCLKYLVLHAEAMVTASNHHRGFLIWMQENKTIDILWSMIDAEWSHVSEVCVQLLLHFVTLPCGSDIFWKLCEKQFNGQNWKVRFQAVEKVVVIGRFLGLSAVRQCPGLQAAIAHAFCFLIASLDDINVSVAQRATLYLTTLPDSGLRALCWCLEQQFDSVIMDRPMIIQALHQLSNRLSDRRILSWDFFFNRFDALYLEAQIALEKHGDIAFPRG
ncbi:unnamed protein product, partial [Meganyctiphanes norvegica]